MQKTKTNSTVSVCYIWRTIKSITLKLMHRHFCVTKTRIFHKLVNMNSHELLLIFFYLLQKCRVGDLEKKNQLRAGNIVIIPELLVPAIVQFRFLIIIKLHAS